MSNFNFVNNTDLSLLEGFDQSKLFLYEYRLSIQIAINGEDEPVDISEYITDFEYNSDFDNQNLYYFSLNTIIPHNVVVKIQEKYRDSVFTLTLEELTFEVIDPTEPINEETLINNIEFKCIEPESSFISDIEEINTDTQDEEEYQDDKQVPFELALLEIPATNINNKLMSYVFNDTTMDDIIYFISSKVAGNKKLVIQKADNLKKYENIIVPPLNFFNTLKYLQDKYGIYDNGLKIFSDFEALWITNYNDPYVSGDDYDNFNIIFSPGSANSTYMNKHFFDEDTGESIAISNLAPDIEYNDISNQNLFGETIIDVSVDENSDYEVEEYDSRGGLESKEFSNREVFNYNSYNNSSSIKETVRQLSEDNEVMTQILPNISMRFLSPNKKVNFETLGSYTEIKGTYRVSASNVSFSRKDSGIFNAVTTVILKRF